MLRLLNKKSLSTVSKQSFAKAFVIPTRKFSVNSVLRHNDDGDGNNVPHSHTHNGQPCGGHSHNHSHGNSQPLLDSDGNPIKLDKPMLMLAFTCKKCDVRSSHVVSKQAYTHGSVLVQCPGCKGRHLVSDHLKIFSDHSITLEQIMRAQGQAVRTNADDLVFEDIPESLKGLIGHHAKNAPEEYKKKAEDSAEIPAIEDKNNKDL